MTRIGRSRKRRQERYTVLAVGEGATERAFLTFLKHLFNPGRTRSVQVRDAEGGSPQHVVERAIRLSENPAYRKVIIWIDADRIESKSELAAVRKMARERVLLVSRPCIEGFFLGLLEPKRDWSTHAPRDLKKHFHEHYLGESEKTDHAAYGRLFTRESLEERRDQRTDTGSPSAPAFDLLDRLIAHMLEKADE